MPKIITKLPDGSVQITDERDLTAARHERVAYLRQCGAEVLAELWTEDDRIDFVALMLELGLKDKATWSPEETALWEEGQKKHKRYREAKAKLTTVLEKIEKAKSNDAVDKVEL